MSQTPADISAFLHTVRPFSSLDEDALGRLAGAVEILYFRRSDAIGEFNHSALASGTLRELFIIRKGAVSLHGQDGQLVEQRGEGDVFGHPIQFGAEQQDYRAQAAEDSLIWQLSSDRLDAAIARSPSIAKALSTDHGQRLRSDSTSTARVDTLADLDLRAPCTAAPDDRIQDCARVMSERKVSSLPIVSEQGLVGILTDRDLRSRVVAAGVDPSQAVARIMTPNPVSVALTARHEAAMVEMLKLGVHHLPVVDEAGRLAGVVSAGDLLRLQSPHPLRLVRDLSRARDRATVARLARQGPALLAGMAEASADVTQIGRIAGLITDACTRRLLQLAEDELGPAPQPFAWLAFGSQARLEQGLISDQDNGLLLAEAPDDEGARYFGKLAQRVCDGLNDCGYVYCPGGVMAKGEWCLSLDQWRQRFDQWMREPTPQSVMKTSIFFDLRGIDGQLELAEQLQTEVLNQARDSEIFRRFLAAESMTHRPPIGFFRTFVQETDGQHSKGLNLKQRGVIPIVDMARVRALEGALPAIHTEERLLAAAESNQMAERDAQDLIHALRFISGIRLEHQARLLRMGEPPNHLVDPAELSGLHKGYLRSAFSVVQAAQQALAQRYQL
ncbi:MAG: DUF294 nucleotidyltransferase-like domain-containing protein [Pseudomonadota bacterium]